MRIIDPVMPFDGNIEDFYEGRRIKVIGQIPLSSKGFSLVILNEGEGDSEVSFQIFVNLKQRVIIFTSIIYGSCFTEAKSNKFVNREDDFIIYVINKNTTFEVHFKGIYNSSFTFTEVPPERLNKFKVIAEPSDVIIRIITTEGIPTAEEINTGILSTESMTSISTGEFSSITNTISKRQF